MWLIKKLITKYEIVSVISLHWCIVNWYQEVKEKGIKQNQFFKKMYVFFFFQSTLLGDLPKPMQVYLDRCPPEKVMRHVCLVWVFWVTLFFCLLKYLNCTCQCHSYRWQLECINGSSSVFESFDKLKPFFHDDTVVSVPINRLESNHLLCCISFIYFFFS